LRLRSRPWPFSASQRHLLHRRRRTSCVPRSSPRSVRATGRWRARPTTLKSVTNYGWRMAMTTWCAPELFRGANQDEHCAETADAWRLPVLEAFSETW